MGLGSSNGRGTVTVQGGGRNETVLRWCNPHGFFLYTLSKSGCSSTKTRCLLLRYIEVSGVEEKLEGV